MRVVILGCGPSAGVPLLNGQWGKCDPNNPKNRRTRVSVALHVNDKTILIDTSPDIRQQCLDHTITRIDAVLYTHDHADHTHGIDDLRPMSSIQKAPIAVYADTVTMTSLQQRFDYMFPSSKKRPSIYRAFLTPHLIQGPFNLRGLSVVPFVQDHGFCNSLGYRIGPFAYSTDVVRLNETAFKALEGVHTWVVDCLGREVRPTHSNLTQTLQWIERVKPKRAILTHMDRTLDYETLRQELPKGVEPGYDGLEISF